MGMKRKKVRPGVIVASADECLAATSTALAASTKYTTSPRARLRISLPHTSCFAAGEEEENASCSDEVMEAHARAKWTKLDVELADNFVEYIQSLVQPHRSVLLPAKHSRFINHPVSTYLINTNVNDIVHSLLDAISGVAALDIDSSQSIAICVSRVLHGAPHRSAQKEHDHYGYVNGSQLLTRLRRLCSSNALLAAISRYMYMQAKAVQPIHFAYVAHRHLIPIAALATTHQALAQICDLIWHMTCCVTAAVEQPVWDLTTDRPTVYTHLPQLHNVDWMAVASDALISHFLRLLHAHNMTADSQVPYAMRETAVIGQHTCPTPCRDWCQRRSTMLQMCLALLVTPYGTCTERYPHTITDFINHRQSVLSNCANHLLTFVHLLLPNITTILPTMYSEEDGWLLHKPWGCSGGNLDLAVQFTPGVDQQLCSGSVVITVLGHCRFVMHMANNIHPMLRPPLAHILLDDDERMRLYMPHVVRTLHTPNDVLILKACQLTYVLIVHVPPCTWSAAHLEREDGRWILPLITALGNSLMLARDMNLLKVIVPQLHDILTRLTYDGLVHAVEVLCAWQTGVALHFRTDTFMSCAFDHINKRLTRGMAPTVKAIIGNPTSTAEQRTFVEHSGVQLCALIKLQCRLPQPFDANLLFHSKEQHKSTLQLLADLHNEAHGVGHLVSLECAVACDMFIERLLDTISEAESTVTEYLAARDTFADDKQIFCDHVVKRVQQLSTVKSFSMLVKKMRERSTAKLLQ